MLKNCFRRQNYKKIFECANTLHILFIILHRKPKMYCYEESNKRGKSSCKTVA